MCACVCLYECVCALVCVCLHMCSRVYVCAYVCVCMCVCVCVYVCMYVYGCVSSLRPGEKVMQDDEFTCDLFRFLQLLCEGHNSGVCVLCSL